MSKTYTRGVWISAILSLLFIVVSMGSTTHAMSTAGPIRGGGLLPPTPTIEADAQPLQESGITLAAQPAFGGFYRSGSWLPVSATISNTGRDRAVEVRISSGGSSFFAAHVDLPNGSSKSVQIYAFLPNLNQRMQVQVFENDTLLARQNTDLRPIGAEIGSIGLVRNQAGPTRTFNPPQQPTLIVVPFTPNELPDRFSGLTSFDTLVIDTIATADLTNLQREALHAWVLQGGHLVIGGGDGLEATLAGLPEALRFVSIGGISSLPADQILSGAAQNPITVAQINPLPNSALAPYIRPNVALKSRSEGAILLEQTYGSGRVTVAAIALSGRDFENWPNQEQFWNDLIDYSNSIPNQFAPGIARLDQFLESNLATVLTNLPMLEFPSLTFVGIMLIAYVLLIGPGTYLILRRLDRQTLAWVIVPVLTILFSVATYGLGFAQRGGEIVVNEVHLIEPLNPDTARARSAIGVFSPAQREYDISIGSTGQPPLFRPISLQGPWDMSVGANNGIYVQAEDQALIRNLAINQWSMQAMSADHLVNFSGLSASMNITNGKFLVAVTNNSDRVIRDVAVFQADFVLRIGDIQPGESRTGELQKPANAFGDGLNATQSVSYLIYGPEIDAANQNRNGMLDPELQLRVRILDTVFSYGPTPRSNEPHLIGWLDHSDLVDVAVGDYRTDKLQTSMVMLKPQLSFSQRELTLGGSWFQPILRNTNDGLCFGGNGTGLNLFNRETHLDLRLTRELIGFQPQAMTVTTSADLEWSKGTVVNLYDWQSNTWVPFAESKGNHTQPDPQRFLSSHGYIRVQFTRDMNAVNNSGCVYVNVQLKGTLP